MDYVQERQMMVENQLLPRGIKDPMVLEAMGAVPRDQFVPQDIRDRAYADCPLPIGEGQTISQPYIVALMTQAARVTQESRVLDIGTGSGYAAAVFSQVVKEVYSIERIDSLAQKAERRFAKLGYRNIEVKMGDGTLGWQEKGPFDAIVVTAGAPDVPESLCGQLADGGCLVIPVGDSFTQELIRITRTAKGSLFRELIEHVRFVPLIGKEGW